MSDDGCSDPPGVPPKRQPDNVPDPGAHFGADFRADSRAISRPKRGVPHSIAGGAYSASRAWRSVRSPGQHAAVGGLRLGNDGRLNGQSPKSLPATDGESSARRGSGTSLDSSLSAGGLSLMGPDDKEDRAGSRPLRVEGDHLLPQRLRNPADQDEHFCVPRRRDGGAAQSPRESLPPPGPAPGREPRRRSKSAPSCRRALLRATRRANRGTGSARRRPCPPALSPRARGRTTAHGYMKAISMSKARTGAPGRSSECGSGARREIGAPRRHRTGRPWPAHLAPGCGPKTRDAQDQPRGGNHEPEQDPVKLAVFLPSD
jgi:hypothetical protein